MDTDDATSSENKVWVDMFSQQGKRQHKSGKSKVVSITKMIIKLNIFLIAAPTQLLDFRKL